VAVGELLLELTSETVGRHVSTASP
jgi:hypothetical protein